MTDPRTNGGLSRRSFLRTTAVAAAGSTLLGTRAAPSSPLIRRFAGVQIGVISYSYRELRPTAEDILGFALQAGLDTVELMGDAAEAYAGAPTAPTWPGREASESDRATYREAMDGYNAEAAAWRRTAAMEPFRELGRMYADAGVSIDILKLGNPAWSDADIDYAYAAARAVGARGISFEASDEAARRMGPFATRHELYNGMHNHAQVGEPGWSFDRLLEPSAYNALNLDIGHYVAGTGASPIPVLRKYHSRITHLHLKDRRTMPNGGDNVPWGEGDTPIGEVLRLIQHEAWPITAMIELEYPVPETSDVLTEVAKCAGYCRGALG